VGQTIAWTATNELRHDLAKHALTLDQSFHNAHVPGEMIERIDGDVTILSNFFSQFTIQLVGNSLLLVGIVLLFFHEDWRVGIALSLYAGAALFVFSYIRNFGAPLWKALRGAYGDLYGFIEERLAGTQDIRSSGQPSTLCTAFTSWRGRFYGCNSGHRWHKICRSTAHFSCLP
jgi:ABC-type multidrug transport system fused ATPase/permease subunit